MVNLQDSLYRTESVKLKVMCQTKKDTLVVQVGGLRHRASSSALVKNKQLLNAPI